MLRRRRPLLRAAAVGGGAYMAGKSHARHQAERDQYEAEQNSRLDDLEYQQQAPAGQGGSVGVVGEPGGVRMGRVVAGRGHLVLLPAGACYRMRAGCICG